MPYDKRCCVPNCPNVKSYCRSPRAKLSPSQQRPCNFSMYHFPVKSYPQRARKWAVAIGKPEMEITSSTFVCSDHFRKVDFSIGGTLLGSWAIPSLNLSYPAPATAAVASQNEQFKVAEGQEGKGASLMQLDKPLDNFKSQSPVIPSGSKRRKFRSPVWEYFIPDPDRSAANCTLCAVDCKIKTKNGSTSSIVRHLQSVHGIILKPVSGINYKKDQLASRSELGTNLGPCDNRISFKDFSIGGTRLLGSPVASHNEQLKVAVGQEGKGAKGSLSQSRQISLKYIKLARKRRLMQLNKPLDNLKNQSQSPVIPSGSQRRKFRSPVWEYFISDPDRSSAKCTLCAVDCKIKTKGGSTSSLARHLQSVHGIVLKPVSGINYKKEYWSPLPHGNRSELVTKLGPCHDRISFNPIVKSPVVFAKPSSISIFGKGQPCLICSSDTSQIGEFRSPLRFAGDSSSNLLDDQLWSTFILRDVLKLPKEDYQNLLERVGASVNPSKWFMVCRICERTVQQILNVHQSLRKLERKLERLSRTMKSTLQESLEREAREAWELNNEKQEDNTILNVRQEIRKSLRMLTPSLQPKQEPLEEEENMISDFDETWLPSPPPPEPAPVRQENPLPSSSPTTCPESSQKGIKFRSPVWEYFIPDPDRSSAKCTLCAVDCKIKTKNGSTSSVLRHLQSVHGISLKPVSGINYKKFLCSSIKRRQFIRRLNLIKSKRARPPSQTSMPRPRRIRIGRKRKPTPVMCELCGQNSSSQCDLEKHMVKHKIYDNSVDLAISTTHLICNLCPPSALFPTRKLLSAHKREKHAEELNLHIFKCSECPETFFLKNALFEHILQKHPLKFVELDDYDKVKIFKCDKCDYQTIFGNNLNRHGQTHEEIGVSCRVICQYCSSSLKNVPTLKTHVKKHHTQVQGKTSGLLVGGKLPPRRFGGADKQFPCKNCDAVFPKKLELKLHLDYTHKDLFTYQCDMCDKCYLSAPSLQTHKKINHLEKGKKAMCGWCGKVVNHKTYLWNHMKCCPKKPDDGTGPSVNAVELT